MRLSHRTVRLTQETLIAPIISLVAPIISLIVMVCGLRKDIDAPLAINLILLGKIVSQQISDLSTTYHDL